MPLFARGDHHAAWGCQGLWATQWDSFVSVMDLGLDPVYTCHVVAVKMDGWIIIMFASGNDSRLWLSSLFCLAGLLGLS